MRCGRDGARTGWTTPQAAARWGRWATYVAVIIPVLYAFTRWAWTLGIPLGISEKFLREGQEVGLWWAGAALATLALGGAILTLGLVQRWGEVFPRWIPFLGGKRVPIPVAVVPASLVAVLVTTAGLMFVRLTLTEGSVRSSVREYSAQRTGRPSLPSCCGRCGEPRSARRRSPTTIAGAASASTAADCNCEACPGPRTEPLLQPGL